MLRYQEGYPPFPSDSRGHQAGAERVVRMDDVGPPKPLHVILHELQEAGEEPFPEGRVGGARRYRWPREAPESGDAVRCFALRIRKVGKEKPPRDVPE